MAETQEGRNGGILKVGGNNGGGRPRKIPAIDTILANVLGEEREINGETISAAEAVLKSLLKQAMKGNVQAAKLLLERGYGMSKQVIDVTSGGETIGGVNVADADTVYKIQKLLEATKSKDAK